MPKYSSHYTVARMQEIFTDACEMCNHYKILQNPEKTLHVQKDIKCILYGFLMVQMSAVMCESAKTLMNI
jgi:hypothetical protein